MGARTKARKRALDVLFEADQRGANVLAVLDERIQDPGTEAALPEYSATVVRGVVEHWTQIDQLLAHYAQDWTIDRMPAVDRALLRLATWETLWGGEVPPAVAISEAVVLAGALSTDESPAFVNGVLAAIAREGRVE